MKVPAGVIADYQAVVEDVDLESIAARERVTRHDVKARIEEFNALAGHEHIHKGMTSRDLTENVEQLQICKSIESGPGPKRRRVGSLSALQSERYRGDDAAARTTSPRRRPRWASASPHRWTNCSWP